MKKFFYCFSLAVIVCTMFVFTGMANKESVIGSDNCYIVDYESGRELFAKGENEKKPIASMVKIMTLLLTFESLQKGEITYDSMVTISHQSASQKGSEMFLDEANQYPVKDLIKGVVTMSANDGSVALAELIAGSEENFTQIMNKRAKELGMKNTLYANATGYPTDNEQYSTAKDTTTVMRKLCSFDDYYKFSTIWLEDYVHPSGRITQMANTNKLIRHYSGCDAGKTGYTDSAKYCLAGSAKRNDIRVVGAVLGAENSKERFRAMSSMFNYCFNNYKKVDMIKANVPLSVDVNVHGGKKDNLSVVAEKNVTALLKNFEKKPTLKYEIPNSVKAPIKKGDVIGKILVQNDNQTVQSINVFANENIAKASIWDYFKKLT